MLDTKDGVKAKDREPFPSLRLAKARVTAQAPSRTVLAFSSERDDVAIY